MNLVTCVYVYHMNEEMILLANIQVEVTRGIFRPRTAVSKRSTHCARKDIIMRKIVRNTLLKYENAFYDYVLTLRITYHAQKTQNMRRIC